MKTSTSRPIIVVSWDGQAAPLAFIQQDAKADFDLFIFDYSGQDHRPIIADFPHTFYYSKKTECKGDLIQAIYTFLIENNHRSFSYIGLLDDDILISISDLNKILFIASTEKLDVFQASLTHDSYYHHRQFVHKAGYLIQTTPWVEIMAPFYSNEVFFQAGKDFNRSISGTGIDVYLIPTVQVLLDKTKTAVVHAVQMKHCRPIRTDNRIFVNGKDNLTEISELQTYCKSIVNNNIAKFDPIFVKEVIDRKYIYGIPLKHKINRLSRLFTNLYRFIVDESYR